MLKGSIRYSRELSDIICDRLASGESLNSICRDAHMPDTHSVRKWVLKDHDGFSQRYARARELQLEHLADELIDISDDARNDWMERNGYETPNGEVIQRSKLRSDNRKWLLSKLKPERYGDRLEMTGAGGSPLIPARTDDPDRIAQAVMLMVQAPSSRPALPAPSRARVIDNSIEDSGDGTDSTAE